MVSTQWVRRAGVVGATAGAVATGAVIGVAAERYVVGRRERAGSEYAVLPGDAVQGAESVTIADDGIPLHVEVLEPEEPVADGLTLLLVHGYALTSDSWHYQARDLRDLGRIVVYDQRGHGASPAGDRDRSTIDQLGSDLARVLDDHAGPGPVVLVGHSMGGMSVMALADRHPELFGTRVCGVALLATSAGRLAEVTLGVPLRGARLLRRAAPALFEQLTLRPELLARGRRAVSGVELALTKHYSYASDVPHSLVAFTSRMIAATPLETVADFWSAFDDHDKLAALDVLEEVETLVLAGEDDLLTPAAHSRDIGVRLPEAEVVVVPASGHLVMLEHPETVNAHLRTLVARVRDRAGVP